MNGISLDKLEEEVKLIRKALAGTSSFRNDRMINVLGVVRAIDCGDINTICIYTIKDYEYTERRFERVDVCGDRWKFQLTHNPTEHFIQSECETADTELLKSSIYEFAAWANNPMLNGDCVILYA